MNSFDSSNHTITGPHYFRVSAVNSAGEGARSSWVLVGDLKGTWTNTNTAWTFDDGVFIYRRVEGDYLGGIYTISYTPNGINLKVTTTGVYIDTAWRDKNQFIEILKKTGETDDSIPNILEGLGFNSPEGAYSIDGNSLTITKLSFGSGVFNRQ